VFHRDQIWGQRREQGQFLTFVTSAAYEWVQWGKEEIEAAFYQELTRFFPAFHPKYVQRLKIIKEPQATLSSTLEMSPYRFSTKTTVPNLFLAGDWTHTGLPATIESAVVSGMKAANAVVTNNANVILSTNRV